MRQASAMDRLAGAMDAEDAPVRVLLIESLASFRHAAEAALRADPRFSVAGVGDCAQDALHLLNTVSADVLVLGVELPDVDGLVLLRALPDAMRVPTIVTCGDPSVSVADLRDLATDVVLRERLPTEAEARHTLKAVRHKAEKAGRAAVAIRARVANRPMTHFPPTRVDHLDARVLIALGASVGGPAALSHLLPAFDAQSPPIVVVQHLPPGQTARLARRLDALSKLGVSEAEDGQTLRAGRAYIAPGGLQTTVSWNGKGYVFQCAPTPKISGHRPSIDALFRSLAPAAGAFAVGVLMTGQDEDGADGLLAMRLAGARTLVQDPETSDMGELPRAALAAGAANQHAPLKELAVVIRREVTHVLNEKCTDG